MAKVNNVSKKRASHLNFLAFLIPTTITNGLLNDCAAPEGKVTRVQQYDEGVKPNDSRHVIMSSRR